MRILQVTTVQAGAFRILVEALKEILTDVNINFTKKVENVNENGDKVVTGGMGILAVNSSHSVLIHLLLDAVNFDEYMCKKNKLTIGLNMTSFFKYIKTMSNLDTLTLFVDDEDPNRLGIRIENSEKNKVSNYKLNLMDLDYYDYTIPPAEFTSVITMPAAEFHKICRDMNSTADFVEIKNVNKQLIFSCKGEIGSQETILGETENGLTVGQDEDKDEDTIIQGLYDLKNLTLFTKFTNLCGNIEMYMKNDYPLIIKYTVASLGQIHLCITPVDQEDDLMDDGEYSEEESEEESEEDYVPAGVKG